MIFLLLVLLSLLERSFSVGNTDQLTSTLKVLEFNFSSHYKLYDISKDPYERVNVINDSSYAPHVSNLVDKLNSWTSSVLNPWVPDISNQKTIWNDQSAVTPWISGASVVDTEYTVAYASETAPHIVFVMVDDWGWNDLGSRSTYLSWTTPTIDSIVDNGISLQNYCTYQTCSPSRGAFLTGKYSIRLGLWATHDQAELPLIETTIAEDLKRANYRTYLVGKWHAGMSSIKNLPTNRGFDYFYGFYSSYIDYWTKTYDGYLDLHVNDEIVMKSKDIDSSLHAAYLFQTKVENVIADHASTYKDQPMFLYYALQLIHSPFTAPDEFTNRCEEPTYVLPDASSAIDPKLSNLASATELRNMCGLNLMLDEVIANLTCSLKTHGFVDNTILIIASDNGGSASIAGNSFPYKGHKASYYRGGVSATAILSSPLIPKSSRGNAYEGLVHVTDWYPMIMGLASGGQWSPPADGQMDGIDLWKEIVSVIHPVAIHSLIFALCKINNEESPRKEIVHHISLTEAVIQYEHLKLFVGMYDAVVDSPNFLFNRDLLPESSHETTCSHSFRSSLFLPLTFQAMLQEVVSGHTYARLERLLLLFVACFIIGLVATVVTSKRHRMMESNMSPKGYVLSRNSYGTLTRNDFNDAVPLIRKA